MRARYYDPALGRFLSEDPIGISGGLNLYAYAGNDPVNAADPSGMLTCAPHAYRVPVTTLSYDGRVLRADTAWDQAVGVGLDCSGDGDSGGSVPGTTGSSKGGGPGGGTETMGRGPKPSCKQLAVRFATNLTIDVALGGLGEVVRGVEAVGHANALLRTGAERLADARAFLREGNAPLAAVMEGTGLKLLANGGVLSAERLGGEQLVARGVAGSVHSFATAQSLYDVAISFIPYAATAVSGYEWVKQCILK